MPASTLEKNTAPTRSGRIPIERVEVSAYQIPTDAPEADGTYAWDATTLVLVEATAGGAARPRLHLRRHRDRPLIRTCSPTS